MNPFGKKLLAASTLVGLTMFVASPALTPNTGALGGLAGTLAASPALACGCVPPPCTLTKGYWQTHITDAELTALAGYPTDPTIVGGYVIGTDGADPAQDAQNILSYNDLARDGVNKLAAQLLATYLTVASNAATEFPGTAHTTGNSALDNQLNAADAFLASQGYSPVTESTGTIWNYLATHTVPFSYGGLTFNVDQQQILTWMTLADDYNNGLLTVSYPGTPAHCSS